MEPVETTGKKGFLRRFREGVSKTLEDLKEDSVAGNPRKPVDCCNPPVPPRSGHNIKE
ncbi:MAG: hypothetical protein P1S46_05960 [bacterium]|nr:hypothetical protein [bacterium]MDT8395339.1 hypothetical protein [bacterium]